jgi:predicted nucleic acid-binding Zn ribbon protein
MKTKNQRRKQEYDTIFITFVIVSALILIYILFTL